MSIYKNETVLNYSSEDIYKILMNAAKRDFGRFDFNNVIGKKSVKTIGNYANIGNQNQRFQKVNIEITDFKVNTVYEVTTSNRYVSRYELYPMGEEKTKLKLTEKILDYGAFKAVEFFISKIFYKNVMKKRFETFNEGLINELKIMKKGEGTKC